MSFREQAMQENPLVSAPELTDELGDECDASIQRSVLIPLELELIGRTVTPRRLVELATSRLFDAEVPA